MSVFWLVHRTSSKKVIYSQPSARSEVSMPALGRGGLPGAGVRRFLAHVYVFWGLSAKEDY